MPRPIWSGAISFGLVNVPVKLFTAVDRKTVRFNQLNKKTGNRIAQKRVDPETGEEVPYEDIVKGYEISKGRYVVIDPEDLEAVEPRKTRMIDIEDFVNLDEIDPIFYDHPYYLTPDKGADKAYKLLLEAMRETDRVAVGRVVLRTKEYLVALRALEDEDVIGLSTMLFADEVVPPEKIDAGLAEDVKAGAKELKMARQLIESLSGPWEPDKYHDEYRERVLELIEQKAAGKEIVVQPTDEPEPVPDLMAALEASIAAAKQETPKAEPKAKAKPKKAAAKKSPAKKKASAKA
jgi:DNA end-binding protein Ku